MGFDDLFKILRGGHHGGHHGSHHGDRHGYYQDDRPVQRPARCDHEHENGFNCPQCSAVVRPESRFCSSCGADLKRGLKCSECGTKLPPKSAFCPGCGVEVKNTGSTTSNRP